MDLPKLISAVLRTRASSQTTVRTRAPPAMLTAVAGTLVGGGIVYSLFVPPGHSRMDTATTKMKVLEDEQEGTAGEGGAKAACAPDADLGLGELDLRRMAQISWAKASDHAGEVRPGGAVGRGTSSLPRLCFRTLQYEPGPLPYGPQYGYHSGNTAKTCTCFYPHPISRARTHKTHTTYFLPSLFPVSSRYPRPTLPTRTTKPL